MLLLLRAQMRIPTFCELRAFVMDGKLTALCQYYNGAFFEKVQKHKEHMLKLVQKLWEEIKNKIPLSPAEYSIDVAVDLENERAYVIELNPFGRPDGMGTGTALFSNKNPKDLAILFGEAPFEFRVETKLPSKDPRLAVKGPLRDWLQAEGLMPHGGE